MSKAFTKESDGEEEELDTDAAPALPAGLKNYITPAGVERLRAELRKLLNEERPKIVEVVHWAAGNGDRSENGDYIYGKRRLREIDRRIRFLTKRLELAVVVDSSEQTNERVVFGAFVTVKDEEDRERVFRIVGIDEIDGSKGYVSWISPLGKALLRHQVGETITVNTPSGELDYEIVKISLTE